MCVTLYVERPRNQSAIELDAWLSTIKAGIAGNYRHAAKLAAPLVVAGLGESVPPAKLSYRQARFSFSQEANDLFLRESLLHVQSPAVGIGLQAQLL